MAVGRAVGAAVGGIGSEVVGCAVIELPTAAALDAWGDPQAAAPTIEAIPIRSSRRLLTPCTVCLPFSATSRVGAACTSVQEPSACQRTDGTHASRHIQRIKSNTKLLIVTVTDPHHSGTRLGHDRDRWTQYRARGIACRS
jgi:hypothetical protein